MALTTTQVNQAFLATLGRPAEGSAAAWGSTSLSLDTLLDSIFIAENTDSDFVEYLYQNILGRASDAEGKAFWNALLTTSSKEAVLAQFKAAVLAAGQADASNADYQAFIAQNKAFVTDLYTNLLGRSDAASADAEGVDFWANALTTGTSKGALLAQFTAAVLANPNSDDAQALSAKMNVANAITAKFNNFNADVTADEKKAALNELKTTMTEVVAGSSVEDFQERIDTFAGNYQNRVAQVFTKPTDDKPTDSLDSSEATASTVFSGNVNLINTNNGTIQRGDSVAGNSNYIDTLRVSVTSDSANKEFDLDSYLPSNVSSVEKLIVTAGAANVSGTLNGTASNYGVSAIITSTGDVDLKISGDQSELKVTAGDKKDAAITVNSGSLNNYTGSTAKDSITVNAGSVKTIDTGAGKDTVEIKVANGIQNEGSIKLGAGDDELTISAALAKSDTLDKISLDGGEGSKDVLNISADITAVNSIKGFETISANSATISADAANSLTSGTKLSDKSNLSIDMSGKNSLNLKNLGVNKAADNTAGTANVAIDKVAKGEITLTSTANNAIVETITLDATAQGTGPVTINKIGAAALDGEIKKVGSNGDKLKITGTTINNTLVKLKASVAAGETQALTDNSLHYVNTKISSADDLASKGTVLALGLTLANGNKALVALNNSSQNKSYIYEITGSDTALTRDNITLKAIVDNAINKYDQVSSDTIEFVAGRETDSGSTTTLAKVANYSNATLDLRSGSYSGDGDTLTFTKDTDKLAINAIKGGKLTVSDGNNEVDAFITSGDGSVEAQATATKVSVYLGGSENASGAITAGTDSLDFGAVNAEIAKGAKEIIANVSGEAITLKAIATNLGTTSVLKLTNSIADQIVLKDKIDSTINLGAKITGGNDQDTVTLEFDSGSSASQEITLTSAKDTAVLKSATITNAMILKAFTTGKDKLDIKAVTQATSVDTVAESRATDIEANKAFITNKDLGNITDKVTTEIVNIFKANTTFADNAKALLIGTSGDNTVIYEITGAGGNGLSTNDTIKLLATVSGTALAAGDFVVNS